MSCETCEHYEYKCGVDLPLQRQIGMNSHPTTPTCYCNFAKVSWQRMSAEIRKPKHITCDYSPKEFTCTECNQKVKGKTKISMVFNRASCICKKCSSK